MDYTPETFNKVRQTLTAAKALPADADQAAVDAAEAALTAAMDALEAADPFRFEDVKDEGAFYYKAVLWAVEAGVTNGMSPTTFAPTATCTRGQIVTFLYRAMKE